jgi:hypothetical protein
VGVARLRRQEVATPGWREAVRMYWTAAVDAAVRRTASPSSDLGGPSPLVTPWVQSEAGIHSDARDRSIMTALSSVGPRGEVIEHPWPGRQLRTWLLLAGIGAVGVYAVGDLLSGLLYDGYSFKDQAISELSAYGSPVRPLALTWITLHDLLGIAFAVGVWLSAGGSRALRWTAGFLLAANVITTPLHPFFPMSSRGMETGFNDTMHLILTMAFGLFVFGAVAASAVAIRGWFRLYAIASLAVIMAFGGLTGPLMSEIANNQPTPWLGAFERINAYTTFAWMVVLAIVLIRRNVDERNPEAGGASVRAPADRALATIPPR